MPIAWSEFSKRLFYWSWKNHNICLTFEEQLEIVKVVTTSSEDYIGYVAGFRIKEISKKIFSHLENMFEHDYGGFCSKYYYRTGYGDEARLWFPILIDSHCGFYGKVMRGRLGDIPEIKSAMSNILAVVSSGMDHQIITLVEKRGLFRKKYSTVAEITFSNQDIEVVHGTIDSFYVATSTSSIHLDREYIRISIFPKGPLS